VVKVPSYPEIFQVLVVCPDLHWVVCALKEVSPLLQTMYHCKKFLVMYLVVPLDFSQALGEECNWMPPLVVLATQTVEVVFLLMQSLSCPP